MEVDRILEQDLDWREAELASLKAEAAKAEIGSVKQRALLRAIWAMLYAHFEGFCLFAWRVYLEEVGQIGLARKQLDHRLAHFSLEKRLRGLKYAGSTWDLFEFCHDEFSNLMSEHAAFDEMPDSQGNLWPDRFSECCGSVGLHCASQGSCEKEIRALVARRNEIAHGKRMYVKDLEEYKPYEDAAFTLMYELALAISDVIETLKRT